MLRANTKKNPENKQQPDEYTLVHDSKTTNNNKILRFNTPSSVATTQRVASCYVAAIEHQCAVVDVEALATEFCEILEGLSRILGFDGFPAISIVSIDDVSLSTSVFFLWRIRLNVSPWNVDILRRVSAMRGRGSRYDVGHFGISPSKLDVHAKNVVQMIGVVTMIAIPRMVAFPVSRYQNRAE